MIKLSYGVLALLAGEILVQATELGLGVFAFVLGLSGLVAFLVVSKTRRESDALAPVAVRVRSLRRNQG